METDEEIIHESDYDGSWTTTQVKEVMVLARADAVKARDAELLEEIKPLIITGAGARNENSAGWNIAIETVIRILSPPKPEEKKMGD